MDQRIPNSPYETTQRILQLVDQSESIGLKKALREIRRISQRLDIEIDFEVSHAERRVKRLKTLSNGPRPAKAIAGYTVSEGKQGLSLSEHRHKSATEGTFRVPKNEYDIIVRAMSGLWKNSPQFTFRQLEEKIAFSIDESSEIARIPDIRGRTVMRFFVFEGIVNHKKARFSLAKIKAEEFEDLAQQEWDDLLTWTIKTNGDPRPKKR